MKTRIILTLAAALALPSLASAQEQAASAGPVAAQALARYDASAVWSLAASGGGGYVAVVPLETQTGLRQEPLPKSRLEFSIPLAVVGAFAGGAVGLGTGYVLLDCSDEGTTCGVGPENGEYKTTALGIALGAATGAYFGGLRGRSKGSFWYNLGAATAGSLPFLLHSGEEMEGNLALLSVGASSLAAALIDNAVRRPR